MRAETVSEDPSDLTGMVVLGRYRLVSPIAEGGMGVIYLARQEGDAGFMRPAVIKRLRPEIGSDPSMVELFMREARILSRLQNPGIVGVLDFAVEGGAHVMALEYVAGFHIGLWSRYLRKAGQPFDPELAIHIVAQVLDTLEYVHSRTDESGVRMGIVHRDVTPSNVLVDREGNVKLLDFGIARSEEEATKDASEGSIKGKFSYLAPEILDGAKPTARGDVYSCGVMLHALIWGRNAFLASTPAETLRRVLSNRLPELEPRFSNIPPGLDAVIAKATAAEPAVRHQTAAELSSALRALIDDDERALGDRLRAMAKEVSAQDALPAALMMPTLESREATWRHFRHSTRPPPGRVAVPSDSRGKWPLVVAAIALLVAAVGGGVAYSIAQKNQAPPPTIIVEQHRLGGNGMNQGRMDGTMGTTVDPDLGMNDSMDPDTMGEVGEMGETEPVMDTVGPNMHSDAPRPEQLLARSFSRSVPALRRCFEEHGEGESTSQISVRLRVEVNGSVSTAAITPTNLPAPLRSCLTQVSESARFDRQDAPITFQVPVSIVRR